MKILLVEDEARLAESLFHILSKDGYVVDVSGDGIEAENFAQTNIYDVIILDRMLPNKEGVEILKSLRKNKIITPVIFLTAKDSVSNRVEGLDAGADDYLIKPFSNSELLARVRALTRRSESIILNNSLQLGELILHVPNCEVEINNQKTKLSLKETQLLELLVRNKNQTLTKEQMLDRVWSFDTEVEMKNVDLYIFYLRKKVDFQSANLVLENIRGVGYALKEL